MDSILAVREPYGGLERVNVDPLYPIYFYFIVPNKSDSSVLHK